jgi:retron-type reverse transcriptase
MDRQEVYTERTAGKMRPLSIPTMTDRAKQALEAIALDPIIESMSDTHSFGFRKERSCQDAREQLFKTLAKRNAAEWIVEGDIKACFDEIAHEWLMKNTPMNKETLKEFLKAGYVYKKELFPTERGTPQGGIVSPILANHTLNGLEQLLKTTYKRKGRRVPGSKTKGKPGSICRRFYRNRAKPGTCRASEGDRANTHSGTRSTIVGRKNLNHQYR